MPPKNPVITPIGNSIGLKINLDIVSQKIRNDPPKIKENGITFLWEEPKRPLIIWGTIKPTKPMIPDKQTHNEEIKQDKK